MIAAHDLAERERVEFADLLDELTLEQWGAPSLCDGWTVRDVAAHTVAYLGQSRIRLMTNMVRAGFDVDRLNARGLRNSAEMAPEQLIGLMRQRARPSGTAALFGGRVALIECLVHQQDIRRPLGLTRTIPAERLRIGLNFARFSPMIAGARRTRGVRLMATDMDWAAGDGPEVRGSGEALLLGMAGRLEAVLSELTGAGLTLLRC